MNRPSTNATTARRACTRAVRAVRQIRVTRPGVAAGMPTKATGALM
ncbi:MAG: hypothetical protein HY916_06230 [Desulfovibrio sp.]|nr:hypothetical protein [Desulfovibrio sp.]